MKATLRYILLLLCALAFAGQLKAAKTFSIADKPRAWNFPRDHGQHPSFQTEWWYFTGNLRSDAGRQFGYQFTIFRRALSSDTFTTASAWRANDVYLAHLALTDVQANRYYSTELARRPAVSLAGSSTETLNVWLADSSASITADGWRVKAHAPQFQYNFELQPLKDPVLNGENGLDAKGSLPGQASYYYSMTRLATTGTITLNDKPYDATGLSWMDHEFGSNQLGPDQAGWDWFSIQLSDGSELMLYQLRLRDGKIDPASGGTFIARDGKYYPFDWREISFKAMDHWKSPHSKTSYPCRWKIEIPGHQVAIEAQPKVADQEFSGSTAGVTYWEGAIEVTGTHDNQPVSGNGYAELTGYREKMAGRI